MLSRRTRANRHGLLFSRANRSRRPPPEESSPGGEPQWVLHRLAAASALARVVRRVVHPAPGLVRAVPRVLLVPRVRVVLVGHRVVRDRKVKVKVVDRVVERGHREAEAGTSKVVLLAPR
jgi:hypothetical protein